MKFRIVSRPIAFLLLFSVTMLFAQTIPYWVKNETVRNPDQYYFGIGISQNSKSEADQEAFVQFAQMIELKVQSITETYLKESGDDIEDVIIDQAKIETEVKLKGITVNERFFDEETGIYYSLIQHKRDAYERMVKEQLRKEVEMLREKNIAEEKKKREELRHQKEMEQLKVEEEHAKMEEERKREMLEQQKRRRRSERERFFNTQYKAFYEKPPTPFFFDFQSAVMSTRRNQFVLKPSVYPLSFTQANYNLYTKYLGFSLGAYWVDRKLELQDFQIRLQLLNERYGVYPIALAVGIVQYATEISDFDDVDVIQGSISPSLLANISVPQLYGHAALAVDRRKLSVALQHYPLFDYFNGKIALILQNDLYFFKSYRNRFNDDFLLQAGINFEVVPEALFLMFSYEDNEFLVLTIDYRF